jgi:hypothetical protein
MKIYQQIHKHEVIEPNQFDHHETNYIPNNSTVVTAAPFISRIVNIHF